MQNKKKVGIIGFGIVGKSFLKFIKSPACFKSLQGFCLSVWDDRELTCEEKEIIKKSGANFVLLQNVSLQDFINQNDKVFVSPGVDLKGLDFCEDKIVCELDLFSKFFKKKTIGITGTLGKTTVTNLIKDFLPFKSELGGNIGRPMLDLIENQNEIDWSVLELSSFQLERAKNFSCDIAIFTNFYSNHLDRHTKTKNYFDAKWKLFENQTEDQTGVFPIEFLTNEFFLKKVSNYKGKTFYFTDKKPDSSLLKHELLQNKNIFFVDNKIFYKAKNKDSKIIDKQIVFDLTKIQTRSFLQNYLIALVVLDLLNVKKQNFVCDKNLGAHRLELFAKKKNIDFYNDSKATVIQATQAAVKKLAQNKRPIILILGGLSKGVDRSELIDFLSKIKTIKKVFFLGKDNREFLEYEHHTSLEDLVRVIMQSADSGDQVLFSPSGASFDMFKNYKERGDAFKKAIINGN